jgi:ribonuclease Z
VHEATFLHELASTAHTYYHSTATQAAEAAKEAGVKVLYMTHFSSRYKSEEQLQALASEAQQTFPASELAQEHVLYPIERT